VTGLTQGTTYKFVVKSRNIVDFSTYSTEISILAAQVPAQPQTPTTTWDKNNNQVVVAWVEPDNGGSSVTGYKVSFKQNDLAYSQQASNCDMTSSTAVTCTIPVSVFTASPYSLAWGSSIYVKVVATNLYGDSTESSEGNGAVITTSPDAPVNLAENTSQRTKSTLGLTWSAGSSNGGASIIDYRISMAESGGSFSVLATGLTSA